MLGAGTYRSAAVNAQLIRYARAAGMREGETAACQANFKALLSMVTPWIYSYLSVQIDTTNVPRAHTHVHAHTPRARTNARTHYSLDQVRAICGHRSPGNGLSRLHGFYGAGTGCDDAALRCGVR